jgi:NADPH-dependent glutamate synthase beta subunit-like oxidoreductase
VSRRSEGDDALQEMEAIATEDDRVTAVHALFMRLHDYDDDDGQGLRDEWRGAVSRYGMDIIGSWVCQH